ncbi:hypothetical protein RchiOBHm_Chr6g0295061 [Rosa chinensis]|uniref:Uncharacterized protein n=1 Tax=Rosa chinensis TaxID=74649 RepID=A0A2P6PX34_ROSCH|nr:hypothetical protein RchiOBHm_Chr6g0295061 [Rosa chinensis]
MALSLSTPYCLYTLYIDENSPHLHCLHPICTPYILHPYNPIMLFCHLFFTSLVQIYLRNCPCPLWLLVLLDLLRSPPLLNELTHVGEFWFLNSE